MKKTQNGFKNMKKGKFMAKHQKCGAYARTTGNPCQAKALTNGRCKNHGGLSTGPKTAEGRRAIGEATRARFQKSRPSPAF